MSNPLAIISPADPAACCSPLTSEPLSMQQAEQVAPLLKALADPVRLRLMSVVALLARGVARIASIVYRQ